MTQCSSVSDALTRLTGLETEVPQTKTVYRADDLCVDVSFTIVDRMSCAFRKLSLHGGQLEQLSFDVLQEWADDLCARVTYLLEQLGPIEIDGEQETVLVRSTPPQQQADQTSYYEAIISAPGSLSLQRFRSLAGQSGREQLDLQCTHEVLTRLVGDLVESIPVVE